MKFRLAVVHHRRRLRRRSVMKTLVIGARLVAVTAAVAAQATFKGANGLLAIRRRSAITYSCSRFDQMAAAHAR